MDTRSLEEKAALIKQARGHRTQTEFATRVGVNPQTLANYERAYTNIPDAKMLLIDKILAEQRTLAKPSAAPLTIEIDPEFKTLIPRLDADEFDRLEESILKEGCRDPLIVWQTTLLDGHHRHEICTKHGLDFNTRQAPEWVQTRQDALRFILENRVYPD
jgi:transcriptional regulator with XRE-family HTH domain